MFCVVFLWGCFVGKSSKKASKSFKTDTTKQSGDYDTYEENRERERERESRGVRIGARACVRVTL